MLRCHDGILLQEIVHICFDEILLQNALFFVFKSGELSIIIVLLCRQTLFKIIINTFVWWNPFTREQISVLMKCFCRMHYCLSLYRWNDILLQSCCVGRHCLRLLLMLLYGGILLQEIVDICLNEMLLQNALLFVFVSVEQYTIIVLLFPLYYYSLVVSADTV